MAEFKDEVQRGFEFYEQIGIHGVIFEGMKAFKSSGLMTKKLGGDFCYPSALLYSHFKEFKEELHARGMKFYCGENRLRGMSDELCCCGIEGLGWKPNTANLNHYIYDRENFKFTEAQRTKKNQSAFSAANQLTVVNIHTKSRTFEELMMQHAQSARSINALLQDEQHLTTK